MCFPPPFGIFIRIYEENKLQQVLLSLSRKKTSGFCGNVPVNFWEMVGFA